MVKKKTNIQGEKVVKIDGLVNLIENEVTETKNIYISKSNLLKALKLFK